MKRLFYLFSLLWCGLFCAVSHAATVEGLYETEIVAVNQSDSERNRLLPEAFHEVLIKVTGYHQLTPEITQQLLPEASRYVRQFRFRNNPQWAEYQATLRQQAATPGWQSMREELPVAVELQEGELEPAVAPAPYLLSVQFDAQMVNRALRELSVPNWGKERPALLLWLVIDEFGARSMIGGEALSELQLQIKQQAKRRGVPLWLPIYDLQDASAVNMGELWGGFSESVISASERYQADVIVVARIQRMLDERWQFRWSIFDAIGESTSFVDALSLEEGLKNGLDQLIDLQAQRYTQSVASTELSPVTLQIQGLNDLLAFASVSEYLQGLESVKSLQLRELSERGVMVELQVLGGKGRLQQLLGLGKRLQPVIDEFEPFSEVLHYRLVP